MGQAMLMVGSGMDMLIMHNNDKYKLVHDIGLGNFGIVRLIRDKQYQELVHVKYIERCEKGVHMDRNDYHGGESTSLNLIQACEKS